jgi:predicted metal-dependent phosphoesterase TrpH
MRIDLHCHTLNSGDNLIRPRDLIREARQRGLDALAVTEHDSFDASEEAERIGWEEGFPVFRGIEVTTDRGHLLLFGIGEDALDLWRRGTYADAEKVIAWAAAQGAAVVSAHPFSLRDLHAPGEAVRDIAGLSAVECLNGRCSTEENAAAELAALAMKLPRVGGSDCHKMEEIARCCTVFETPILSPGDLVREIRAGRCRPERLR